MFKGNVVLNILQNEIDRYTRILNPYFISSIHLLSTYIPLAIIVVCLSVILWIIYTAIRYFLTWKKSNTPSKFLEISPPSTTEQSTFTTAQLFNSIHGLLRQQSWVYRAFDVSKSYSFEIVSTKDQGIRYVVRVSIEDAEIIKKSLISYLSGIQVKEIDDYLSEHTNQGQILPIGLAKHFALPLKKQENLEEYDPISYITGTMTKLSPGEIVALQAIITPIDRNTKRIVSKLRFMFLENRNVLSFIQQSNASNSIVVSLIKVLLQILLLPLGMFIFLVTDGREGPLLPIRSKGGNKTKSTYRDIIETQIKQKIDQQLFSVSLRFLTISHDPENRLKAEKGFIAALSPFTNADYQSLKPVRYIKVGWMNNLLMWSFRKRVQTFFGNAIFSTSEISNLYHFPYAMVTKTENLVKLHYHELPAPLTIKNTKDFDVVFGKNTYGNGDYPIGLTVVDRSRHVFCIGQTGSGKSTIIFHMAKDDMAKGRGVAIIDPHGDLAEDLLAVVPENRINDCYYFNPFDFRYPMGINILELTKNLDEDEMEQEKEIVCEGVISVFRRIFSKDENVDAHRIEYILRNSIYTAFTVPDATIFTVYDLLNNPTFQKKVTAALEDENLKNFWKNEFGRAGNYQIVKMVSGVTARIGRILFSPTAKRILEQPQSTVNFDEILNTEKILICNVSEGKLGEDTSQLLGTIIIAKIQQAVMRRARMDKSVREPFYLFIDEFQNFATSYFTKLLSGGRKFGLNIFIAEQSTSQQDDRNVVNVTLANTGTVICFRSAGPIDNQLMLDQFSPYVTQLDIINLPQYHFYIKLSAANPEEPFSGITLPMYIKRDQEQIDRVVDASRTNYAIKYERPTHTETRVTSKTSGKKGSKSEETTVNSLY